MIGICIELKTECKHCSTPLMLNALTEDILCRSCNKINSFPFEKWASLLEDCLKEAPKFKLGEGQPSTVMSGEYKYGLMYGRQEPRCSKCKQGIDVSKIDEYSSHNGVKCSKCSNLIDVRKPSEAIAKAFPKVKYLVGEDSDMLSVNKPDEKLPDSVKPVLFTCPSCAGNLEIDGTDRMISCKFCDSQIYLPDDLWFRLHPAKTVERWYMLVDGPGSVSGKSGEAAIEMPEWYYLSDVTSDKKGNVYIASATEGEGDFIVWSFTHDLKMRWIREGLKFGHEGTGITVTHDGHLYLWDKSKHSLTKLSSKDGSTIKKIEGDKNRDKINMMGCTSLVSCPDGTILTIINNSFARFRENGERVKLWKARKFGLFPSGKGTDIPENDEQYAPYVKDIGSSPRRLNGGFTKLDIGYDGFLYMIDRSSGDGEVAKYDMDGRQLWSKYIPLHYKECKACTDGNGNVYVVGLNQQTNTNLFRMDADNLKFKLIVKDIIEGGQLNEEDQLAVTPDGTVFVFRFYNRLKVFSPDMKMIFRSKQSEKEDNEKIKKKQKAIENDEEFSS